MVYVLSKDGKPLMPTERHGKVRRLLKEKKAKVVNRTPFTIQLLYDSTEFVQACHARRGCRIKAYRSFRIHRSQRTVLLRRGTQR